MGELVKKTSTGIVPVDGGENYTFATRWQYDSRNRIPAILNPDAERWSRTMRTAVYSSICKAPKSLTITKLRTSTITDLIALNTSTAAMAFFYYIWVC